MKKIFKIVTLAVVLSSSTMVNAAQKVAVVFPSKIMQQSPQLEKIKNKLEAEFKDRIVVLKTLQKEIADIENKLKRDAELMTASEVTELKLQAEVKVSEFTLKRKAFNEDNRRRQAEEQQNVSLLMQKTIQSVAEKNGYDLVLNGEQVFFAQSNLDISDIVIKEISKK